MHDPNGLPSRRDAIRLGIAAGAGLALGRLPLSAHAEDLARQAQLPLVTKPVPGTGEPIPVVGIGTNRYSVTDPADIARLRDVLRRLPELGGSVVDTARGYGRSEEVIGQCVEEIGNRDRLFIATKYSLRTGGDAPAVSAADARAGLELAFSRLRMDTIDLMMVHNLAGTEALMPLMVEMKQAGRFRYLGVSTSSDRQYDDLARLMRSAPLDFVQVDYSIGNRSAENVILPLAQERGMAIMTNVPFGGRGGTVLQQVGDRPLPAWAAEIDCTSWAQVFLKYLVSHPAVTVAIPGTTRVEHLVDNNGAARGRMPDGAMRRRIEQYYDAL
jgi:aryl-alcohol dehydrogenase-like predicted oxidoreductase